MKHALHSTTSNLNASKERVALDNENVQENVRTAVFEMNKFAAERPTGLPKPASLSNENSSSSLHSQDGLDEVDLSQSDLEFGKTTRNKTRGSNNSTPSLEGNDIIINGLEQDVASTDIPLSHRRSERARN